MRKQLVVLLLVLEVSGAMAFDTRPLERHLRTIEAQVHSLGKKSFLHKYTDGKPRETYTVKPSSYSYRLFEPEGQLAKEWTLRKGGQIAYEAWYAPKESKERLLEDERTVSYSSFYPNQQKWEQYSRNKEKDVTSYYIYDEDGKLLTKDSL